MEYTKVQDLTQDNYYQALAIIQNRYHPNQDIMTITGFMNWDERVKHYATHLPKGGAQ